MFHYIRIPTNTALFLNLVLFPSIIFCPVSTVFLFSSAFCTVYIPSFVSLCLYPTSCSSGSIFRYIFHCFLYSVPCSTAFIFHPMFHCVCIPPHVPFNAYSAQCSTVFAFHPMFHCVHIPLYVPLCSYSTMCSTVFIFHPMFHCVHISPYVPLC